MKRRKPRWLLGFAAVCALVAIFALHPDRFPGGKELALKLQGKATVADRLGEVGPTARERLKTAFDKAGLSYPPAKLLLVGLKAERRLQLYAPDAAGQWHFVRFYDVLGASGHSGPKLREGDLQVPEGFYRIESLNPNSAFHLALRVNYPNEFDRANAKREGRTDLGGNIMIHGSNASIGCLAMGDTAAEDLFVLAADTGLEKIDVVLCPADFRDTDVKVPTTSPRWTAALYGKLAKTLKALPPAT